MKIALIISNGSEEVEALAPVDVLRRAGVECDIISTENKEVTGSHGIKIIADKTLAEFDIKEYYGIILPGGMPGTKLLANNKTVLSAIQSAILDKKLICAICAAPALILKANNLLKTDRATCYPSAEFIKIMGDVFSGEDVTVSDNYITANGPKSAINFGMAICEYLGVNPKF